MVTKVEMSEDMIEQVINDWILETGKPPEEMTGREFVDRLFAKMCVSNMEHKA